MKPRIQSLRRWEKPASSYLLNFQRSVHFTKTNNVAIPASSFPSNHVQPTSRSTKSAPLARLPATDVFRSYLITAMSSSPALLSACFAILQRMLQSNSIFMDVDKNPVLAWILKKSFYAQFCAGENRAEVHESMDRIRALGYKGVILEFALESLGEGNPNATADSAETKRDIELWRKGAIASVNFCAPGDFVGLKWSGLGPYALKLLKANQPPTPLMQSAITELLTTASARGVSILPGAEEHSTNPGISTWNRTLQRQHNTPTTTGRAILYTTYQCYDRSTPSNIALDLAHAKKHNYIAGVKLVRGAYLATEPRHLLWSTIEDTHACYDAMLEQTLKRSYGGMLQPTDASSAEFPEVDVILATHNAESVRKARSIRDAQAAAGEKRVRLAYAQLQGMADEVSCQLLDTDGTTAAGKDVPRAFKLVTYGTTRECLNYLLRRAAENRDAAERTGDTRRAMGREIWRRMRGVVGLA